MKLLARAAIDAAETGHSDVRPGDTFDASGDLASALLDSGKAEAVDKGQLKSLRDAQAVKAKAKAEQDVKAAAEKQAAEADAKAKADAEAAAKAAKGG